MTMPMSGKKLYRIPERGVVKGVCAGLAEYMGVPVALVRVMAVLSIFCGLFIITAILYMVLAMTLPTASATELSCVQQPTARQQMQVVTVDLNECEQRLRRIERYVTSETFGVNRRFRDL